MLGGFVRDNAFICATIGASIRHFLFLKLKTALFALELNHSSNYGSSDI